MGPSGRGGGDGVGPPPRSSFAPSSSWYKGDVGLPFPCAGIISPLKSVSKRGRS